MEAREKFAAALLLFVAWIALAYGGLTPVEPLVQALRDALIALGIFTASMADPRK